MSQTLRFDGRVALITGAGRGIGRAHALLLAARGAKVVIADAGLDISGASGEGDPAAQVAAEIKASGGEAIAFKGDVVKDAAAMVDAAIKDFGRLDILINNAGPVGSFGRIADGDAALWRRVTEIHYYGTASLCRAAWPHLAASGAGRIVNTSSAAMFGSDRQSDYGSAKSAVFGLTRSLAIEGRTEGINVNCILPSGATRMMGLINDDPIREATMQIMAPEHIAAFVAWLVHSETPVTGEAFNVGGGRAVRVLLAAGPAVKMKESTPEAWCEKSSGLFGQALTPLTNMLENFSVELCDIAPDLRPMVETYLATGLSAPKD